MTAKKKTSTGCSTAVGINTILKHEFRNEPPILQRGILPAGGGLFIAGDSGVGKSLLRNEISIRLAIGLDVFGIRTPTAQKILIFQTENTMQQEQFRTKRMMQGMGIEQLPDRIFYSPPYRPCSLQNKEFLKYAMDRVRETGANLMFFDPLVSFHNRNENDNVQMRNVLDCITYMSRETGAASAIIHHFGKPPSNNPIELQYRMRGAMALRDWCDTAITITPLKSKDHNQQLRQLDFIKIRNGPWHPPIILERDGNFVHTIAESPEKAPPYLVAEIVEKHFDEIATQNDLVALVRSETDCSKRTALKAVKKALSDGYISEKIVDGRKVYESNQPNL
jgi:RecA-family ATPase